MNTEINLKEPIKPEFKINNHHRLRNNCWTAKDVVKGGRGGIKRGITGSSAENRNLSKNS